MKERKKKIRIGWILFILIVVGTLIWSGMVLIDYYRVFNGGELPLFAQNDIESGDGIAGVYHGLGYTIDIESFTDETSGSTVVDFAELSLFGNVIAVVDN